tara:strand:+ start:345 stop:533 length:189 start_codon:yes stop_codon:yes gene_type:complete
MTEPKAREKGYKDTWRPFKIGNGRALMVTKLLPKKWNLVEVSIDEATDGKVRLSVRPVQIQG